MDSMNEKFIKTFLVESPQNTGNSHQDLFSSLSVAINDFLKEGVYSAKSLGTLNAVKMVTLSSVYFWTIDTQTLEFELILQLEKKPLAWTVRGVDKNPKFAGAGTKAVDLYALAVRHSPKPIALMSDTTITTAGFRTWEKLINLGCKILVYDNKVKPIQYKAIHDLADLKSFYDTNPSFKRYQYVLSESIGDIAGNFGLKRLRDMSGTDYDGY